MRFKRTEESELRVINAYKRLNTYKAVAEEIGCSWNTVQRIIVKRGFNPGRGNHTPGNNGGGSAAKITDAELMEEAKTMSLQEIAAKHGMHIERVRKRAKRLDLHLGK